MAAIAYNLKKLIRYEIRRGQRLAKDCIAFRNKTYRSFTLVFSEF
jgi:hypothetical protein